MEKKTIHMCFTFKKKIKSNVSVLKVKTLKVQEKSQAAFFHCSLRIFASLPTCFQGEVREVKSVPFDVYACWKSPPVVYIFIL